MKLVICEKPKVAEKIAYALGRGSTVKKALYGVPYYEVERDGQKLVVVSAVGHIYTLRQKDGERSYPVFDIEWAPSHEVEKGADYTKKYLEAIEKLAPGADEYICACDFDIEGSLIGYNVIRFLGDVSKGSRMKFSALTSGDLEEAFEERAALDIPNALAGEARHMLDWFYGINLSRALMGAMREAGAHQVMSIGRVQGPALAILAKKEKEIASFVSTPYWELVCKAKETEFENSRGRFLKKDEAQAALAASKPEGVVQKIEKREYLQAPPVPFDLTTLQVEAYRALGVAPARTLELAQTLYENSLISYPRTSSQKLPAKLNLKKIISELAKTPAYAASAGGLLASNRIVPLEGKKDDPAHPAIHPTGLFRQLGEKEMKLYDLIAKRFLSCFGTPAKREAQKVEILSGSERYVAGGSRTVEPGWFAIYEPYVKLDEKSLPPFSEGEHVALSSFQVLEKKTQPPKRYTPASIVSELEKLGLGTKATRATIVETLFKRGYLDGTSIKVTPFGLAVFDSLSKFAPEILDEELTRGIEEEMEKIADGENEKKAIEEGKAVLERILKKFDGKEKEVGLGLLSGLKVKELGDSLLGKCVKCGGDLRAIRSRMGKQFVGCSNYPKCTATYPLPQGAKIVPLGKACEKCGTPMIRVIRKARKTFEMCIDPACETKKSWARPAPPANPVQKQAATPAPTALTQPEEEKKKKAKALKKTVGAKGTKKIAGKTRIADAGAAE
ncbi:MAG: DNA topoisomerase I [Candidatus Anstonellaceae archaeon]